MGIQRGIQKLQDQFNENPLQVIAIGSIAAHGMAKIINAVADYKGKRIYAMETERRIRNDMRGRR